MVQVKSTTNSVVGSSSPEEFVLPEAINIHSISNYLEKTPPAWALSSMAVGMTGVSRFALNNLIANAVVVANAGTDAVISMDAIAAAEAAGAEVLFDATAGIETEVVIGSAVVATESVGLTAATIGFSILAAVGIAAGVLLVGGLLAYGIYEWQKRRSSFPEIDSYGVKLEPMGVVRVERRQGSALLSRETKSEILRSKIDAPPDFSERGFTPRERIELPGPKPYQPVMTDIPSLVRNTAMVDPTSPFVFQLPPSSLKIPIEESDAVNAGAMLLNGLHQTGIKGAYYSTNEKDAFDEVEQRIKKEIKRGSVHIQHPWEWPIFTEIMPSGWKTSYLKFVLTKKGLYIGPAFKEGNGGKLDENMHPSIAHKTPPSKVDVAGYCIVGGSHGEKFIVDQGKSNSYPKAPSGVQGIERVKKFFDDNVVVQDASNTSDREVVRLKELMKKDLIAKSSSFSLIH